MYIRTYDTFDIIFASNKVESFLSSHVIWGMWPCGAVGLVCHEALWIKMGYLVDHPT